MQLNKKKPLGSILVEMGKLTEEKLINILNRSDDRELTIGSYLLKHNIVDQEDIAKCIAQQSDLEYISMQKLTFDKESADLIPKKLCEDMQIIPIRLEEDHVLIGVVDPSISLKLQKEIDQKFRMVIISLDTFKLNFSKIYEKSENIKFILQKINDEKKTISPDVKAEKIQTNGPNFSVEKLVNDIIVDAVRTKASDIHIEADDELLRVRLRVDGVLIERETLPIELHNTIISRLKLIAGLDITEKRMPQDGRIELDIGSHKVDLRVSTLPTIKGEKSVLRILDKESVNVDIDTLNIDNNTLKQLKEILNASNGIILVTGPTGSGKTTTVYSMLKSINNIDTNIITVEDPVEYHFKLINQVQINTKAGLSFANALRSILRQDPDVIMIGEIRDKETAEIAIKAALTGHLVISTLHTNDAISTVQRLIDIGVEPYLVSSALLGVVAQRLVRKVCKNCNQEFDNPNQSNNFLDEKIIHEGGKAIKAVGCEECYNSGHKGRLPIFELFIPDDEIRHMIKNQASDTEMTRYAHEKLSYRSMFEDGLDKIKQKLTTSDEVLRQISGLKKS